MSELVNYRKDNSIAYIGMNRPEKRNSLSADLVKELNAKLFDANEDKEVRAVILYGEGKAFSAGGDIDTLKELPNTDDAIDYMKSAASIVSFIKGMDKFVIGAVHGFAAGAGFSLALASDFIVANDQTKFVSSFTKIGLIPDLSLMKSLLEKVPAAIAKEWIVSGKPIVAEEAYNKGIVNKLSSDDLLEDATAYAQFIIDSPPLANQFVKFMMEHINEYSNATNVMQENMMQTLLLQTEDKKEGMQAFMEKRKPIFKGF